MVKRHQIIEKVKIFGMTNQLLESDLAKIESKYSLDLGRNVQKNDEKDERYYPQFEQSIRNEAAQMAEYYEIFYCLENSIRALVIETLKSDIGLKWWDSGKIPNEVHQEVAKRIQRDIDSGMTLRSEEPIEFTTFGELGEIIKGNWDIFGGMFTSKRAVERVMANLNLLRGPIAHCSPLADDEVDRLRLTVKDWFRLME